MLFSIKIIIYEEIVHLGDFFSAISDYVLNQNGYVFGAIYNKKMEVVHYGTNKKEEIQLFRGSKYVQSKIGHTYQEAKKLLQTGCLVCFSGTPCQIAGLKNYLKERLCKSYHSRFGMSW